MQSRIFNDLSINLEKSSITKTSLLNKSKIRDEINYYLELPKDLSHLFPKLINYCRDHSSYTMEYIPYETLSELILRDQIKVCKGKKIITNLVKVLDKIHSVPVKNFKLDQSNNFLISKTVNRINQLKTNSYFCELMKSDIVKINGKQYKSFHILQPELQETINKFFNTASSTTVIHGDFCFSNILYCSLTEDIKLIDPRGSFEIKGIFGNPYYDYAKLMHCLNGQYDYIVNDHFSLEEIAPDKFNFHITSSSILKTMHAHFCSLMARKNINLQILYLIEATLFLSMATLHYEDQMRQKALYINGIIILNNFLKQNIII